MTTAFWSMGTLLQRQNPVNSQWETVVGLRDIDGPNEAREQIEYTNMNSPGGREELLGGIIRSGTVSGTLNWNPGDAVHQAVRADFSANRTGAWKIVAPDTGNAEIAFSGFVQTFGFRFSTTEVMAVAFALKISGDVTLTY